MKFFVYFPYVFKNYNEHIFLKKKIFQFNHFTRNIKKKLFSIGREYLNTN